MQVVSSGVILFAVKLQRRDDGLAAGPLRVSRCGDEHGVGRGGLERHSELEQPANDKVLWLDPERSLYRAIPEPA